MQEKELFTHYEGKVEFYCREIIAQIEKIKKENKRKKKEYFENDKKYLNKQMKYLKQYINEYIKE
jgi:hypothetical protein